MPVIHIGGQQLSYEHWRRRSRATCLGDYMDLSCQSMAALMLTDCNRYQRFGSPEGARRHETRR
jgi:hypothetical protein